MFAVFVGLLSVTGLMRLIELAVSVRRQRARPGAVVRERGLFLAMAALHTALVALPLAEVWWLGTPFRVGPAVVSALLLLAATVLRVWTLSTIGPAWNVRIVRPEGAQIATTGPYAWIRHPNYVCVVVEILALPLFHGAWVSLLVLSAWNAAVLAVRIPNEEAVLSELPEWERAFRAKARLIPGIW